MPEWLVSRMMQDSVLMHEWISLPNDRCLQCPPGNFYTIPNVVALFVYGRTIPRSTGLYSRLPFRWTKRIIQLRNEITGIPTCSMHQILVKLSQLHRLAENMSFLLWAHDTPTLAGEGCSVINDSLEHDPRRHDENISSQLAFRSLRLALFFNWVMNLL